MLTRKRKKGRIDEDDHDIDNVKLSEHKLLYYLDKIRALHKKIDSAEYLKSTVQVKGTAANPQITIELDSARYELLKRILPSQLSQSGSDLVIRKKENIDKSGAVVSFVVFVDSAADGKALYSVNFYNTTSRILVNRIKDISCFLEHYTEILNNLSISSVTKMNKDIISKCKAFLSAKENSDSENGCSAGVSSPITDNTVSSCDIPTTSSTANSSDADAMPTKNDSSCSTCKQLSSIVSVLLEKIEMLDKSHETILNKLDTADKSMKEFIQSELSLVKSKMECRSTDVHSSDSCSLVSHPSMDTSPGTSIDASTGASFHASADKSNKWYKPSHKIRTPPTNALDRKRNNNNAPNLVNNISPRSTKLHTTLFKPIQNIVVSINKSSSIYKDFSQDSVRRTMNNVYGSIIIEKINRYRFQSDHPKIMIQLESSEVAKNLVAKWKSDTFDGSSARNTIDPASLTLNVAMLRGVPLDANDDDVISNIEAQFPGAQSYRVMKEGRKLRLFKVKFSNDKHFIKAIDDRGFQLISASVICHFEKYVDG